MSTTLQISVTAASIAIFIASAAMAGDLRNPSLLAFGRSPAQGYMTGRQPLKNGPSIPYIPLYCGNNALLEEFAYCPSLPNGQSYTMRFLAIEDPHSVHSWYQDNLPTCGWKLADDAGNNAAIVASRDPGMSGYIYVRRTPQTGYRTEVVVRLSAR